MLVAVAGLAISQFVSAQTQSTSSRTLQISQGPISSYASPQQGCYPNGQSYNAPYGDGFRMGMCARFG